MTHPDKKISKYFSELSKKRKNPYSPFKDNSEYAKEMSLKAVKARREKKRIKEQQAADRQNTSESYQEDQED